MRPVFQRPRAFTPWRGDPSRELEVTPMPLSPQQAILRVRFYAPFAECAPPFVSHDVVTVEEEAVSSIFSRLEMPERQGFEVTRAQLSSLRKPASALRAQLTRLFDSALTGVLASIARTRFVS